jgi:hypothetical protein
MNLTLKRSAKKLAALFKIIRTPTGLPDGLYKTKNPNFGKIWRALE